MNDDAHVFWVCFVAVMLFGYGAGKTIEFICHHLTVGWL